MTARARRCVVEKVRAAEGISERRAVRWTGFARSTIRYESTRPPQDELRARIREFAGERPRWGYRRIHVLLRREGWVVNRKRVQRLYREGGLAVRRKGKRRRSQAPALVRGPLAQPDERWSLDFVSDTLSSGRTFRCLTVIDEYTREALAIEVAHSLPAARVIEVMERLRAERGLPPVVIRTTGPSSHPGRSMPGPMPAASRPSTSNRVSRSRTCFIESFNGSLRDECLNLHWFVSLEVARRTIEQWRVDYNQVRPHSSLGERTPEEFASDTLGSWNDLTLVHDIGVRE